MQLQSHTWEHALLSLAYEARQHNGGGYGTAPISAAPSLAASTFDAHLLNQAYAYCEMMTAHHSHSFFRASRLLPPDARRAVRALYAFCRVSDDIVDNDMAGPPAVRASAHERWRALVMASAPPATELVAVAWTDARLRYQIPLRYAEQLIDGIAQDGQPGRYETFLR